MTGNSDTSPRNMAARLGFAATCMFGFGFALVPLYDVFCEVTGIRAPIEANAESSVGERPAESRTITLELLANTGNGAPWEFRPVADKIEVQTGLFQDTVFVAHNLTGQAMDAVATPDIKPAEAGRYLRKIECFCFSEQHFEPGETRDLGVRFYVDPELPAYIDTITLSYTLFERPALARN